METQKFTRNPIEIEAVQVTPTNIAEVAVWCKGGVTEATYRLMGGSHKMGAVLLPKQGPKGDKTRTVLIGHWITRYKNTYKAWTLEAFEAAYTRIYPKLKAGDLIRAKNEIWEGWEGKVEDPHMVGVSFGSRGRFVFQPDQIEKIDEMDSRQLELNAGVELDAATVVSQGKDPMTQILDEMREKAKDRLAELEAENLAYDDEVIRVGDLVKIGWLEHPSHNEHSRAFVGRCGHVCKDDAGFRTVKFSTDDPDAPAFVTFDVAVLEKIHQTDEPKFNIDELVKITEGLESEYNGQCGHVISIEDNTYLVSFATDEGNDPELAFFHRDDLEKVKSRPSMNLMEEDTITINDLRERMGLERLPGLLDKSASSDAIEFFQQMNDEEKEKFSAVQKAAEESSSEEKEELGFSDAVKQFEEKIKPAMAQFQKNMASIGSIAGISMEEIETNVEKLQDQSFGGKPLSMFDTPPPAEEEPLTLDNFYENDMVETISKYAMGDGFEIPAGTTGTVTVVGCGLEGTHEMGVEVLFSDGNYGYFLPAELKLI